jgi:hypothetical protein
LSNPAPLLVITKTKVLTPCLEVRLRHQV